MHAEREPVPEGGFVATARFLDCVHCGLCQTACPTYLELGTEQDSPRGRIHLMRALQEGRLPVDADAVRHLDLCLGCRGCETACPSGVRYGTLIEAARPWIEAHHRRPFHVRLRRRLTVAVLTTPHLLRALLAPLRLLDRIGVLGLARRTAGVRSLLAMLPDPLAARAAPAPETAAPEATGATVLLLVGCVMPELFGNTVRSTIAVLTANGCRVLVPPAGGCCGALALHAGDRARALAQARRTIAAFEAATPPGSTPPIVVNAAGCGALMKEYGALFADDPAWAARAATLASRVRDATEILSELPLRAPTAGAPARRIAYHDACHLAHGQGIRQAPRRLLAGLPGVTVVSMDDEDLCCGSAGHYNVMQPAMARRLVGRKVAAIRASGAEVVATANSGCALQLQAALRAAGSPVPVRHLLDLLADAYAHG